MFLPTASVDDATSHFLSKIQEVNPKVQIELIEKAFRFSWNAHKNQSKSQNRLGTSCGGYAILQNRDWIQLPSLPDYSMMLLKIQRLRYHAQDFGEEVALLVDGNKDRTFR